jgi:hypothetical protein
MPAPGILYFTCIEPAEGFPGRPGMATFEEDGSFTVQTFEPGDGLMPGRYAVKAECWKEAPGMGRPRGVSYLPDRYGDLETGGWELEIAPGSGARTLTYDIRSR